MPREKDLTEFEKAVSIVAGQIFACEMSRLTGELKQGQSISIDEVMNESVLDAFTLVEKVVETARA